MDENRPGYYAIIPADVRYDDRIPPNAKLLYGEISALTDKLGYCHAGNQYFCELYGFSDATIARLMKALEDCGYIRRELIKEKSGKVIQRKIWLNVSVSDGQPPLKNETTPSQNRDQGGLKNEGENNTSIIVKKESKKKKRTAKEPTVRELDDDALDKDIIDWIARAGEELHWTRDDKNAIYRTMKSFYAPRDGEHEPSRLASQVHTIQGRCLRFSEGQPKHIVDMLERSITGLWTGVFDSQDYHKSAPKQTPTQGGDFEEW